jgi:hypothetical protein
LELARTTSLDAAKKTRSKSKHLLNVSGNAEKAVVQGELKGFSDVDQGTCG